MKQYYIDLRIFHQRDYLNLLFSYAKANGFKYDFPIFLQLITIWSPNLQEIIDYLDIKYELIILIDKYRIISIF